jgi:transcriptional regulator GlxA family with amidase domain
VPAAVLDALRQARARHCRLLSLCTGAFVLAEAGILDGHTATTHWSECAELARRYPRVSVDPGVLYTDETELLTSAGSAASLDLCLHVVQRDYGTEIATQVARDLVVPLHREGGQAQYINRPLGESPSGSLAPVLDWMTLSVGQPLSVADMAAHAHMSPRTFARRFTQETGTTPLRWLTSQRVLLAQQLLEDTDDTVDAIAEHVGFGNAATLRHHFRAWRDTTPDAYRRLFRGPAAVAEREPVPVG